MQFATILTGGSRGSLGSRDPKDPPIYQRCQKYDVLVLKCIIS